MASVAATAGPSRWMLSRVRLTELDQGFHKHNFSKEHLACCTLWKEQERRIDAGKQISTTEEGVKSPHSSTLWDF